MEKGLLFLLTLGMVVLAAFVLLYPCFGMGFLGDDYLDLDHGFGPGSFARFEAGGFRPLMAGIWALDSWLYGPGNPVGWHSTNVLLHLANLFLTYLLLRQLGLDRWTVLFSTAFFALSFATVPSVCRVSGRTTVAAILPLLGALNAHVRWKRSGRKEWMGLSLFLVLVSLMVKETALACPLVFGALSVYLDPGKRRNGTFLRDLGLYLIPVAVYAVWRLAAVGTALGYSESAHIGPWMLRNLLLLASGVFSPWLSGLSARMLLILLPLVAWLIRGRDGLGILGLAVMLGLLITVSNLPPRSYYAYAGLPGAALIFAAATRLCIGKSRKLLAAIPVLLLLGSFLQARDEVGRMREASEYTEALVDGIVSLDESTAGRGGTLIISGYREQLGGYQTIWPGAFDEMFSTRGRVPVHSIADEEGFWEVVFPGMDDLSTPGQALFAQYSPEGWSIRPFRPADRDWLDSTSTATAVIMEGRVTVDDSFRILNSCRIVSEERCSLSVMDPLSNTLHVYRPVLESGDTAWFDLEDSRAWLISSPPFYLYVLGCTQEDEHRIEFSARRFWLPRLRIQMERKEENLATLHR